MINEELLVAYAEGVLAPADRMKVEAAAARDPSIARRLMDQVGRRRRSLSSSEPPRPFHRRPVMPSSATKAPQRAGAEVVDLAKIRAARAAPTRPPAQKGEWRTLLSPAAATAFVAASLAVGLVIGAFLTTRPASPQVVVSEGALYAQDALLRALTTVQAGRVGAVLVGPLERARDARLCRPFRFYAPPGLAGVACQSEKGWRLETTLYDDGRAQPKGSLFPPKVRASLADLTGAPAGP